MRGGSYACPNDYSRKRQHSLPADDLLDVMIHDTLTMCQIIREYANFCENIWKFQK